MMQVGMNRRTVSLQLLTVAFQ